MVHDFYFVSKMSQNLICSCIICPSVCLSGFCFITSTYLYATINIFLRKINKLKNIARPEKGVIIHPLPLHRATSHQCPLSSVPKVAFVREVWTTVCSLFKYVNTALTAFYSD